MADSYNIITNTIIAIILFQHTFMSALGPGVFQQCQAEDEEEIRNLARQTRWTEDGEVRDDQGMCISSI